MTPVAALLGLTGILFSPVASAVITSETPPAEYLKADAPPISWMVRMGGDVSVEVPNPKLTMAVGKQLSLFQQADNSYVAITTDPDGEHQLTAFPRYVGNEPSAWVSIEHLLVFGRRTPSIRSVFSFDRDEILPLVRETPDAYIVDVQRFGRHLPLTVSKKTAGMVLVPVQKPESHAAAAARTGILATKTAPQNLPAAPEKITAETALLQAGSPTSGDSEMAIAKIKEEFIKDLMGELEKVKQQRAVEEARLAAAEAAKPKPLLPPVEAPPAVIVQKIEVPVPEPSAKEPPPGPGTQWTYLADYARENAITLLIIAIAAIVLPIIAIGTTRTLARRAARRPAAAAPELTPAGTPLATEVFTFSSVGESHSTDTTNQHHHHPAAAPQPASATSHGDLSGTLSGHILPQVVQFFCAARESGKMSIRQEGGLTEELLFNNGSIIDARTGSITGKDAARAILQQRDGKFNFHRANTSNDKRHIQDETMSLLLEAHQALDESRRTRHGT